MKHLFIIGFALFPPLLLAQKTIEVKVIHNENLEPLVFANLYLTNSKIGTSTDLKGEASIEVQSDNLELDTLKCSFIGYEEDFRVIDLSKDTFIEIKLTPDCILLDEITIVPEKFPEECAKDLLKMALIKVTDNYCDNTTSNDFFYRELTKENGKTIELNDAIATINYTRYPQKRFHKKSFKAFWGNPYTTRETKRLKRNGFLAWNCQYFMYFNTIKDSCFIKNSRFSDNLSSHDVSANIGFGPLDLTSMDKVKYKYDFLDPELIDEYHFSYTQIYNSNDEKLLEITFVPKPQTKSKNFPIGKRVSSPVLSGTLALRLEDLAILSFKVQLANLANTKHHQERKFFPFKNTVEVHYSNDEHGKLLISFVESHQTYLLKKYDNAEYEVVRTLKRIENPTLKKQIRSLEYDYSFPFQAGYRLRKMKGSYKEEFWLEVERELSLAKTDKFKEDFAISRSLQEQFGDNN